MKTYGMLPQECLPKEGLNVARRNEVVRKQEYDTPVVINYEDLINTTGGEYNISDNGLG
jgi:hypothetical protein